MKPITKLSFAVISIILWLSDFIIIPCKILFIKLPEGAKIFPTYLNSMKHHILVVPKELNETLNNI